MVGSAKSYTHGLSVSLRLHISVLLGTPISQLLNPAMNGGLAKADGFLPLCPSLSTYTDTHAGSLPQLTVLSFHKLAGGDTQTTMRLRLCIHATH